MWKYGITATIAAAALIAGASPARADLVHVDWVHEMQEKAPTGTVAAAFGYGR